MLLLENCLYQPFYCEENIWQLCKHPYFKKAAVEVIFMLPKHKEFIAVWQSKMSKAEQPILWDYHVVLHDINAKVIYDFDTLLPFPIDAEKYFFHTFSLVYPAYLPLFKVFQQEDFALNFFSDRTHMQNKKGKWLKPPPEWDSPRPNTSNNKKRISFTEVLDVENTLVGKTYSFYEMVDLISS
jgi:hypothetical protein